MNEKDMERMVEAVRVKSAEIILRLFVPSPLVQPGLAFAANVDLRTQFEGAAALYRKRRYSEALRCFLDVGQAAESFQIGAGRTAHLNAAACAIMEGQNDRVVELLFPLYSKGRLYGLPLWNLALAYYHLGNNIEALRAVESWLKRAPEGFRGRGLIVAASLSAITGDESRMIQYLGKAIEQDRNLVTKQFGLDLGEPSREILTVSRGAIQEPFIPTLLSAEIPHSVREQLLRIINPKRPEWSPALSEFLTREEMEGFATAIESMAEGDQGQAIMKLAQLRESHPGALLLEIAVAACELFAGNNEKALEILAHAEGLGVRLPGSALWNLAYAQIQLGNLPGALRALKACSETEYRSKSELWTAIDALGRGGTGTQPKLPHDQSAFPRSIARNLTDQLPVSVEDCRRELLHRLLRPKKMPQRYRPDLIRLSETERRGLERVLDRARRATPSEALSMLLPLTREHSDIYTLKAHASAFALLSGNLPEALALLRQGQSIRPLDATSRNNLAYICLVQGDMPGVAQALEGGVRSSLGEKFTFWLALAIAREAGGLGESAAPAARALALASGGPSAEIVKEAVRLARIRPAPSTSTEDPIVAAARKAIACIDNHDIPGAASYLSNAAGPAVEDIPEIGRRIFEPQFEPRPSRFWSKDVHRAFTSAGRGYNEGRYGEAAAEFNRLYRSFQQPGLAINMIAAYLKAGEPRRARTLARAALRFHRGRDRWEWRLIYNLALAYLQLKDIRTAVRIAKQYLTEKSLSALIVAICASDTKGITLREFMGVALEKIRQSANPPSDELMLAFGWAKLTQSAPDVEAARTAIQHVAQRREGEPIQPPAEVISMKQVRAAYEHFRVAGRMSEAISYLETVIETRVREREFAARSEFSAKELELSVGVELSARVCLVQAHISQSNREMAIQVLDESETLLHDYAGGMPRGFLAKDWMQIGNLAHSIDLPWAALRYCDEGLKADAEQSDLQGLQRMLHTMGEVAIENELVESARNLTAILNDSTIPVTEILKQLQKRFNDVDLLRRKPILLSKVIESLFESISKCEEDVINPEELCDRANVLARMELPSEAAREIETLLNWFIRHWGGEQAQIPIEIDAYDGKIWPRSDEREGCCLIALTAREDVQGLSIFDIGAKKLLWHGNIASGRSEYLRWMVERDDGFIAEDLLDLPVLLQAGPPPSQIDVHTAVAVSVMSGGPRWPTYPTGALSPDDVPGNELYGRSDLIKKITGTLGQKRAQAAYFLEAPRQMGKTSLLYFVKKEVPAHVLAVYVNLELPWGRQDPLNPWNCLIEKVLAEAGSDNSETGPTSLVGKQPQDLVQAVSRVCDRLGKNYVLLLLDDLHSLLERCDDPRSVLAVFREFHNNTANRISLLLADRYTREELEARNKHEYWAQLSILKLGPLDHQATVRAIRTPTEESDVVFLPEAIDRLYSVTGGYPYHIQRAAQYILDSMWAGPWVIALPQDVDDACMRMVEEDWLFQIGLCRPDRIDMSLEEAIAALLEWRDLLEVLPSMQSESEWADTLRNWEPKARDLLAGLGDPDNLLRRLEAIGVIKEIDGAYSFFSLLLERWLKKMRNQGRSLRSDQQAKAWAVIAAGDGAYLNGPDWQRLDNELIQRCIKARVKPPLRERLSSPDDWEQLVKEVATQNDFRAFIDLMFRLFIDEREDKQAILSYPWLTLAYHRVRLVRNYFVHEAKFPSQVAMRAWDQVCTRALGRQCKAYRPAISEEWRAIQVLLLRTLFAGIRNAIALVGTSG